MTVFDSHPIVYPRLKRPPWEDGARGNGGWHRISDPKRRWRYRREQLGIWWHAYLIPHLMRGFCAVFSHDWWDDNGWTGGNRRCKRCTAYVPLWRPVPVPRKDDA